MAGRPRSGRGQGVRLDRWVKTDEINSNNFISKHVLSLAEAVISELPSDEVASSLAAVGWLLSCAIAGFATTA